MDSRNLVVILFLFLISCDDLSCRFNKVPDAPYPNPDRVEEFKTNIINQVTYFMSVSIMIDIRNNLWQLRIQ